MFFPAKKELHLILTIIQSKNSSTPLVGPKKQIKKKILSFNHSDAPEPQQVKPVKTPVTTAHENRMYFKLLMLTLFSLIYLYTIQS